MTVASLFLQPVLYLWCTYSSQPSQHVCSLLANSGGHFWGDPQASYSALLQTMWKVCYQWSSRILFYSILVFLDVSIIFFCDCRYLQPPATWVQCALESRELLSLCLKKIKSSMTKVNGIVAKYDRRKANVKTWKHKKMCLNILHCKSSKCLLLLCFLTGFAYFSLPALSFSIDQGIILNIFPYT